MSTHPIHSVPQGSTHAASHAHESTHRASALSRIVGCKPLEGEYAMWEAGALTLLAGLALMRNPEVAHAITSAEQDREQDGNVRVPMADITACVGYDAVHVLAGAGPGQAAHPAQATHAAYARAYAELLPGEFSPGAPMQHDPARVAAHEWTLAELCTRLKAIGAAI